MEDGFSTKVPIIRDGESVVADSFAIALYLEENYPDRPSLFRGEGGRAMARFVEGYSQMILHPFHQCRCSAVHDLLDEPNKAYFRESREKMFGRKLEDVAAERDANRDAFTRSLAAHSQDAAVAALHRWQSPSLGDYIIFGAFQWVRVLTPYRCLRMAIPCRIGSSAAWISMAALPADQGGGGVDDRLGWQWQWLYIEPATYQSRHHSPMTRSSPWQLNVPFR